MRVAVGTRATAFAPVQDLGLVVVWDDGDDLHAEPRAPYPHVRDVLVLRAHLTGAAVLVGGHARTAEGQLLVETGWARPLVAARAAVRAAAPAVDGTGDEQLARDPLAAAAPAAGSRLRRRSHGARRRRTGAGPGAPPRLRAVAGLRAATARPRAARRCSGPLAAGVAAPPSPRAAGAAGWPATGAARSATAAGCAPSVVGARRTAEELGRAFPGTTVRTSGRDGVLASVAGEPALVVSTPGAEPVADGGYGAVLLLDGWALLGRADLRAGEEALRRWTAAAALARPAPGGRVVVVADRGAARRCRRWCAGTRRAPPRASWPTAPRWASRPRCGCRASTGPPAAVAELLAALDGPPPDVLGPVPAGRGARARAAAGAAPRAAAWPRRSRRAAGVRSARKAEPVRVQLDPLELWPSGRPRLRHGGVAVQPIRLFGDPVLRTPAEPSPPSTRSSAARSRT